MNKIKCLDRLNGRYRAEIRELESVCNHHDKTNWKVCLTSDTEDMKCFYLYFEKRLLGFLSVVVMDEEVEVRAFVHPSARQQGIFKKLMAEAKKECKKFGIEKLVCYLSPVYINSLGNGSKASLSWALGKLSYSEFKLEFSLIGNILKAETRGCKVLNIQKIKNEQEDAYHHHMKLLFEMEEEEIEERLQLSKEDSRTYTYFAYDGECCIGFFSLYYGKTSITLFDFGVVKEYQGRGYAYAMLSAMVNYIRGLKRSGWSNIILHVSSKNEIATKTYLNFGFHIKEQLDCYEIPVL